MAIALLYFARVREAIGLAGETIDPPSELATVGDLLDWLAERGGGYADAFADRKRLRGAIDQAFVPLDAPIAGAREIAIFPRSPAAEAAVLRAIRVQAEAFDPGAELASLEALGGGAVASFTGIVRGEGGLVSMTLEHYPAMTEAALDRIVREARRAGRCSG